MTEEKMKQATKQMSDEVRNLIVKYMLKYSPAVPICVICVSFLSLLEAQKAMGLRTSGFEATISQAIDILKKEKTEWMDGLPTEIKEELKRVASDLHL